MARTFGIGLDLSEEKIILATAEGESRQFIVHNQSETLVAAISALLPSGTTDFRLAAEASSLLDDCLGSETLGPLRTRLRVAQPNRVAAARRCFGWSKSDINDARTLAVLAEQNAGADPQQVEVIKLRHQSRLRSLMISWRRNLRRFKRSNLAKSDSQEIVIQLLREVEKAIAALALTIQRTADENFGPDFEALQSVPGIGPKTASRLLAELGDIDRFKSHRNLVGLSGLHPYSRASGRASVPGLGSRLGRHGNRHLREAFLAAVAGVRLHHPVLSKFDADLRARGKAPMVVRVALARRLAVIVFKTLKQARAMSSKR